MRFTFKNKVSEKSVEPEAVFDMWQLNSFLWIKERKDMGEVTLGSELLKSYCDSLERGENIGGCYSPELEDLEEFKKALKALQPFDSARKARSR